MAGEVAGDTRNPSRRLQRKEMEMIVIRDNVLPVALLRAVQACWPATAWPYWHHYEGENGNKYGSMPNAPIPAACRKALDMLADRISLLIGDPAFVDYDFHAAALHQIPPGGFLARHQDAERHPSNRWRRVYSLVYFVDTLRPEHGGELLLPPYDRVRPCENRMAIFDTADQWHEVLPTTLDAPVRRTLALFCWAVDERCEGTTRSHFEPRPKRRAEDAMQTQHEP